jgi:hypothetical protein
VIPLKIEGETEAESSARLRSRKSKWIKPVYDCVTSPLFNVFIFLLIVLSTFVLAADDFPKNNEKTIILESINSVLNIIFLIEMLLKWYAIGI